MITILLGCELATPVMAKEYDGYNSIRNNMENFIVPNINEKLTRYSISPEGMQDLIMLSGKILSDNTNKQQILNLIKNDPSLQNYQKAEQLIFSEKTQPIKTLEAELEKTNKYLQLSRSTADSLQISRMKKEIMNAEADAEYFEFNRLLLKKMFSTSFPDHWEEVNSPTDQFRAQGSSDTLGKDGIIYNFEAYRKEYADFISLSNNDNVYYERNTQIGLLNRYHILALEPVICYAVNGYASILFKISYYGLHTAVIDGFSKITVTDIAKHNRYAAGTMNQNFKKPLKLMPGQHSYIALIFNPGTWNNLDWIGETNSNEITGNQTKYNINIIVSNSNWERDE